MEGLRRVLDWIELHVVDIAGKPHLAESIFVKSFHRACGTRRKASAHRPIAIALRGEFERGIECADGVNFPSTKSA